MDKAKRVERARQLGVDLTEANVVYDAELGWTIDGMTPDEWREAKMTE